MKFSEVTVEDIKEYCNAYEEDTKNLTIILSASKGYIKSYTGRTVEDLDKYEEIAIASMILCNEMFENRVFSVENDKVNTVVQSILDMHSFNLL
ncbi:head-tail connector protein [Clostridium disporicum]|uniref:head-tail connector protein n=1 Tax=Clostridium disporicum TaxID=84024 RepID=UPI0034A1D759